MVAFSPDGSMLLTADHRGHGVFLTEVWDAKKLTPIIPPTERNGAAGLSFTAGGRAVFGFTSDEIRLWDPRSGKDLTTITGKFDLAIINPKGDRIAAVVPGEGDRIAQSDVAVYDALSGKLLRLLPHPSPVSDIALSPDVARVLTAAYGHRGIGSEFRLWDVKSGAESFPTIRDDTLAMDSRFGGRSFTPDGGRFVLGASVFDTVSGKRVLWLRPGDLVGRFSEDGKRLVAIGNRGVTLWDAVAEQPITDPVHALQILQRPEWARGGSFDLVSLAADGTKAVGGWGVWDLTTGDQVWYFKRPKDSAARDAMSTALSPDGRTVATAEAPTVGSPGETFVWRLGE
jgi:WD40 repeat protein